MKVYDSTIESFSSQMKSTRLLRTFVKKRKEQRNERMVCSTSPCLPVFLGSRGRFLSHVDALKRPSGNESRKFNRITSVFSFPTSKPFEGEKSVYSSFTSVERRRVNFRSPNRDYLTFTDSLSFVANPIPGTSTTFST